MVVWFKSRLPYIIAAVVLLVVEILIGVFVHDGFVRPYIGDVLVTVLLCTFGQMIFFKMAVCTDCCVFVFGSG